MKINNLSSNKINFEYSIIEYFPDNSSPYFE